MSRPATRRGGRRRTPTICATISSRMRSRPRERGVRWTENASGQRARRRSLTCRKPARNGVLPGSPEELPEVVMSAVEQSVIIQAWNTVLFDKFFRFRHLIVDGLANHSNAALARRDYAR